jgi:alanine racemase
MVGLGELLEGTASQHPVIVSRGSSSFTGMAHDSRNVVGGELFVGVRTATGDGHTFANEAFARGAAGFLVDRPIDDLVPWGGPAWEGALPTVVRVDSTREALAAWAAHRLRGSRVVVVAGSLGKSTAQASVRAAWAAASGSPVMGNGDRNDSFGIPLALAAGRPSPSNWVLEVVATSREEEGRLDRMLSPVVFCALGTNDAAALYWRSRSALADGLVRTCPRGALVVRPISDLLLERRFRDRSQLSFGSPGSGADVEVGPYGDASSSRWPAVWSCRLSAGGRIWDIPTRLHPALAAPAWGTAVAVLIALGEDLDRGIAALGELHTLPGRLSTLTGRVGGTLLDDTIDATPSSVSLALEALEAMPAPRLAILGEEWGRAAASRSRARRRGAGPEIVLVGDGRPAGDQRAGSAGGPTSHSLAEAAAAAGPVLNSGGSVLLKGTSKERLERLASRLAVDGSLLVRQQPGHLLMSFRSARRPTWVEVDLDALAANVVEVTSELHPVPLMAVVKADAYGHGAVQVARTALQSGAEWIATATVAEAASLRAAGIGAPCLVLGYTPPVQVLEAVAAGLVLTVFDLEVLAALEAAGERLHMVARAHLKVDTGMTRLGIAPRDVAAFCASSRALRHVELEGVFTHFRKGQDAAATGQQLEELLLAIAQASRQGHHFRLRHAASSAAWKTVPEARLDLVRCGAELLGLRTPDDRRRRPVLTFKTTVAQLHRIDRGSHVGYGDAFRADGPLTVATIPVGYGDGFRRGPANWGEVLIRGRRHQLVGDVAMDMAMVDVTGDTAVSRGDQVVLIGRQGDAQITAEEVGQRSGTINYEVVTQILPRVPREVASWH